jgi:hypothetical protein
MLAMRALNGPSTGPELVERLRCEEAVRVIDNLVIGLTHGLLLLTTWRLIHRPELDDESAAPADADGGKRRWGRKRA